MKLESRNYLLASVLAILTMAAALWAQSGPPAPPPPGAPGIFPQKEVIGGPTPDDTFAFLGFEMSLGDKVVKGVPYSAETVTEFNQVLADGNRISRKTTAAVYRDSEGRTRREQVFPAIGPLTSGEEPPRVVFIHDPVAGLRYVLEPREKVARKMSPPTGAAHIHGGMKGGPFPYAPAAQSQTEDLGKQTIDGIVAEGTRITTTIPAGQIGNERPIVIVRERWYSPDLQTMVMTKRSDPRFGETVFRLTNIRREEPAPSLFQVPPDYTLKEMAPGKGGRFLMRRAGPPGEDH